VADPLQMFLFAMKRIQSVSDEGFGIGVDEIPDAKHTGNVRLQILLLWNRGEAARRRAAT